MDFERGDYARFRSGYIFEVGRMDEGFLYTDEWDYSIEYWKPYARRDCILWKPNEDEVCLFWNKDAQYAVIGKFKEMAGSQYLTLHGEVYEKTQPYLFQVPYFLQDKYGLPNSTLKFLS
ncbi:MAG: hypothetical protein NTZ60_00850 [Campylobacterales bacterium]|nr:hypothetical protein [Campylobacterales bacterium]